MKPFVKWAGGKTRLLKEIEQRLPVDFNKWEDAEYIEPFVGGGSVLFYMLQTHKNITRAVINDINPILMESYSQIKHNPTPIIETLRTLKSEYIGLADDKAKEDFYYLIRKTFNEMRSDDCQKVAFFIFLNHTCFNGLYRENKSGCFNVPHGRYNSPAIFDEDNLIELHTILQMVEIHSGDFYMILDSVQGNHTFIYLDPPYRPISKKVLMFTLYDKSGFKESDQRRLKDICDIISNKGCKIMISNSDSFDDNMSYFESQYTDGYHIDRIQVTRMINPYNSMARKQKEVIITNYQIPKI